MYCTKCGIELLPQANFCTRCGTKAAIPPHTQKETTANKFWRRFAQAVVMQLQQQAVANAMQQRCSGDNFWSSTTASGNDNGQSGYVDVGGTIVGYDR